MSARGESEQIHRKMMTDEEKHTDEEHDRDRKYKGSQNKRYVLPSTDHRHLGKMLNLIPVY